MRKAHARWACLINWSKQPGLAVLWGRLNQSKLLELLLQLLSLEELEPQESWLELLPSPQELQSIDGLGAGAGLGAVC